MQRFKCWHRSDPSLNWTFFLNRQWSHTKFELKLCLSTTAWLYDMNKMGPKIILCVSVCVTICFNLIIYGHKLSRKRPYRFERIMSKSFRCKVYTAQIDLGCDWWRCSCFETENLKQNYVCIAIPRRKSTTIFMSQCAFHYTTTPSPITWLQRPILSQW